MSIATLPLFAGASGAAGGGLGGLGALLSGAGSIAGLFGGRRSPKVFGRDQLNSLLNRLVDTQANTLRIGLGSPFSGLLGFRRDSRDGIKPDFPGGDPFGDIPGLFEVLLGTQGRDVGRIEALQRFSQKTLGQQLGGLNIGSANLNRLTEGLNTLQDVGTSQALQATRQVREKPLEALGTSFEDLRKSTSRDLGRTIEGIFRQANADAASRGIKSAGTSLRAAEQGRRASESVFDRLAQIGISEAGARSNIEQVAAQARLGTVLSRAQQREQIASQRAQARTAFDQFDILNRGAVRNQALGRALQLFGLQRQAETAPQQAALDVLRQLATIIPGGAGTPVPSGQQFGDKLASGLGQIGGLLASLQASKDSKANQAAQQQFLLDLLNRA